MKSRYRPVILIIVDVVLIYLSYIFAFLIRFEGNTPKQYIDLFIEVVFILVAIKIVIFYYFKLYENLWRYAGVLDVLQIVVAVGSANAIAISYLFLMQASLPRSIYVLAFILDVFFMGGSRFGYRVIRELSGGRYYAIKKNGENGHSIKVLIIGAGEAGAMVIRELRNHPELNTKPVAILDDDKEKHRRKINGVPVLGSIEKIKEAITSIQDDFEKILVITHITDFKDAFPMRIEVVKTPEGSTIYLN